MPDTKYQQKRPLPVFAYNTSFSQERPGMGHRTRTSVTTGSIGEFELSENAEAMLRRLDKFRRIPDDWDSCGAMASSEDAIQAGKRFVRALDRLRQHIDFTAPGPNGEVSVELKFGTKYMEFVFYPAGKWKYTAFEDKVLARQGNYDNTDLPSLLRWLNH